MRELFSYEVLEVSGGGWMTDLTESSAFGGTVGTIVGFVITDTVQGATRGGLTGAALGFAYGFGYGVGTVLYEYYCG